MKKIKKEIENVNDIEYIKSHKINFVLIKENKKPSNLFRREDIFIKDKEENSAFKGIIPKPVQFITKKYKLLSGSKDENINKF